MLGLLPALLAGLVALAPAGELDRSKAAPPAAASAARDHARWLDAPDRRVRATDDSIRKIIALGLRRSATFAALFAELERTDVIVYVERNDRLPAVLLGRLLLVPVSHGQRYLRIQLAPAGSDKDAIATLAHELQHALEIGAAPDVRNDEGMVELYKRIGQSGVSQHTYDTLAAQATGRRVKLELEG